VAVSKPEVLALRDGAITGTDHGSPERQGHSVGDQAGGNDEPEVSGRRDASDEPGPEVRGFH
jgi:hypothetical protein